MIDDPSKLGIKGKNIYHKNQRDHKLEMINLFH